MGDGSGGGKGVWVAIALLGALVIAILAAGVFWAAGSGQSAGVRSMGALKAGSATFVAVATLAIATGTFLVA
jgi:hypothetical protein